jgi:hypothetical protein
VCLEVLQHISEVSSALDEIRRVLRPGGNVIVSFPFMLGECDVADFRRWTVAGMSHEFEKRDFSVVSVARRGGLFYVMTNTLIWAANKAVLGDRRTWRASRTLAAYAQESILVILTFPLVALGWLAFAVDSLLPQSVCYTGALIFASREVSAEHAASAAGRLTAA